jgi:hypothetical protein
MMAGQAKHRLIKSGTKSGGYNADPHGGNPGRGQNLYPPAAGEDYNKPLRGSSKGVVGPPSGAFKSNAKGYQSDAHSGNYHHHGEAVGHLTDSKPMHYSSTLHGEGNSEIHTDGVYGKAAHHGHMGEPHRFANNKSGDGYGYSASNMKGALRLSGHPHAHRIGSK